MIIDKKCSCGNNSTGNTTIRCCNLCGLPMPTEPWHFNLPENIFSPVEPEVGKLLLSEIRKHYLVEIDIETGEPKADMKTLMELWDKVNKYLEIKTIGDT